MLKSVNITELKICGIPKTQPSNVITALENYNVRRNSPTRGTTRAITGGLTDHDFITLILYTLLCLPSSKG
jgi:hypothetical protein